ncbi:MAG: TetR/AcrR family transcriptional regulator [Alphaproteobacteria bacterium]|nr:TetR/AcrR family transcriptional regulator [Alphaproteobacteria bacterium]
MVSQNRKSGPRRDAGPAVTRDPHRSRELVLGAATLEFSEKGLGGARVDEIARRAGINKRMLYHYFGNKDALYLAVLERVYGRIRQAEKTLSLDGLNPRQAMEKLVAFSWQHFIDNPAFISLLNDENLHKAAHVRQSARIREMHSPLVGMIDDLLARGEKSGEFRAGVDPVQLYITIAAISYFYLSNVHTLSAIFDRDLLAPDQLAHRRAHVVDVILDFLRPGASQATLRA